MPSFFEWFIIAIIVVGIAYVGIAQSRRAGQANPVSTGKLEKELRALSSKVGTIGGTVVDLQGAVTAIGKKVDQVERDSVTAADIASLKELIEAKHEARFGAMTGIQTDINIIKTYLLEKGLGGR
ncbi:MAG TPA: hypothetical protein VF463_10615 [Sphingobium sp.]